MVRYICIRFLNHAHFYFIYYSEENSEMNFSCKQKRLKFKYLEFFLPSLQFLKILKSFLQLSSLFQRSVTLQSKIKPNYPIMDMAVFNGETSSSESSRKERSGTRKRRWTENVSRKFTIHIGEYLNH